ncbi:MAG: hypothetical protein KIG43_01030 [Eubacteriales bacterium]|nr:hypothetical protein [Eubacteriales bacterium]MCI7570723.1 hypothetical protein [Clostridiales bacterium]MDD7550733.1 hypothetical protein [Clostridia bacterium]MDY5754429.1 hypothetical protein [Eubacteriales bacterium]
MDTIELILILLYSLALTILIEGVVVLLSTKDKQMVKHSVLCNLLTNPIVNLVLILAVNIWGRGIYVPVLFVVELLTVGVEAYIYKYITGMELRQAVFLSMLANAASWGIGAIIGLITG